MFVIVILSSAKSLSRLQTISSSIISFLLMVTAAKLSFMVAAVTINKRKESAAARSIDHGPEAGGSIHERKRDPAVFIFSFMLAAKIIKEMPPAVMKEKDRPLTAWR